MRLPLPRSQPIWLAVETGLTHGSGSVADKWKKKKKLQRIRLAVCTYGCVEILGRKAKQEGEGKIIIDQLIAF